MSNWANTRHHRFGSLLEFRRDLCWVTPWLGPLLFTVYTSPVGGIIASHGVHYHQYADDTQLHLAIRTADADAGLANLSTCTAEVKRWYLTNGLQLNASKSEVILSGTSYQLSKRSCCRFESTDQRGDENTWRYNRQSSYLQKARFCCDQIMQLSRPGHPTHSTPAFARHRTHAGPQFNFIQA